MKLLVDTNILVYDTIEDSEYHGIASKIIDEADEIYIPSIVIHEYLWVMIKKLNIPIDFVSEKIKEYIEELNTIYFCENMYIIINAMKLLKKYSGKPSEINDYLILSSAKYLDITLATFDKKLRRIASMEKVNTIP
jgi:predicted nucleic acid-binding protein